LVPALEFSPAEEDIPGKYEYMDKVGTGLEA
jgi:hypothetical protein